MPSIHLDQSHRATTMAVVQPSILSCLRTSGPDVHTRGIAEDHQTDLRPGESMLVKPSTLLVRIFSTQSGNAQFSADLVLDESAAARIAFLERQREALGLTAI
jgi:hypothetical protein